MYDFERKLPTPADGEYVVGPRSLKVARRGGGPARQARPGTPVPEAFSWPKRLIQAHLRCGKVRFQPHAGPGRNAWLEVLVPLLTVDQLRKALETDLAKQGLGDEPVASDAKKADLQEALLRAAGLRGGEPDAPPAVPEARAVTGDLDPVEEAGPSHVVQVNDEGAKLYAELAKASDEELVGQLGSVYTDDLGTRLPPDMLPRVERLLTDDLGDRTLDETERMDLIRALLIHQGAAETVAAG